MLLAIDVGNSNIKMAFLSLAPLQVQCQARISSNTKRTADEYYFFILAFCQQQQYSWQEIEGIIISSVVPSITAELQICMTRQIKLPHLYIHHKSNTGLSIQTEKPHKMGSDLIANAVGGSSLSNGSACICISLGTATTFTVVNQRKEITGVAIMPGLQTGLDSLLQSTALLHPMDFRMPSSAIGKNTAESMQAGLLLGHIGAARYIVKAQLQELDLNKKSPVSIYYTGFLGALFSGSTMPGEFQEDLLFIGLGEVWKNNLSSRI